MHAYVPRGQQKSKMASKISGSQDFIEISGFLWDLWDYFPYFTKIFGKNIAWDFGSRISSKNSARISASATKISACCGPLDMYIRSIPVHAYACIYLRT